MLTCTRIVLGGCMFRTQSDYAHGEPAFDGDWSWRRLYGVCSTCLDTYLVRAVSEWGWAVP